jgi:hypothetical protein
MAELPFPLSKYHKGNCRRKWETRGMIFVDDEYFEYVYNEYIHTTNCDLCNKEFLKSLDRQLDHEHETGEIRNIVCNRCNQHKKDRKHSKTNTGEDHITKTKDKDYKTGYCFGIHIIRDGKNILNTKRNTLEKAIICRDEFIEAHPEIYT